MKKFSGIMIICALVCACTKKDLSPHEFMEWYGDKNVTVRSSKDIGNYNFSLLYRSPEYIYLQERRGVFNPEEFKKRKDAFGNMQYYLFTIKGKTENEIMAEDVSADEEYFLRLEYFTGLMQDDISLVEGNDTLPCMLFHYERNYGLSPNNNFLLAFEKSSDSIFLNTDKFLIYNDKVFGTGPVSLNIKAKDIRDVPSIKE